MSVVKSDKTYGAKNQFEIIDIRNVDVKSISLIYFRHYLFVTGLDLDFLLFLNYNCD